MDPLKGSHKEKTNRPQASPFLVAFDLKLRRMRNLRWNKRPYADLHLQQNPYWRGQNARIDVSRVRSRLKR